MGRVQVCASASQRLRAVAMLPAKLGSLGSRNEIERIDILLSACLPAPAQGVMALLVLETDPPALPWRRAVRRASATAALQEVRPLGCWSGWAGPYLKKATASCSFLFLLLSSLLGQFG